MKSVEFARKVVLHGSMVMDGESVSVGVEEALAVLLVDDDVDAVAVASFDTVPPDKDDVIVELTVCEIDTDEEPERECSCDSVMLGDAVGVGLCVTEK